MRLKLVFCVLAFFGLMVEAQGQSATTQVSGLPFVTAPLSSPEQYARLVETGQPQNGIGLYLNPDTLLLGWKAAYPDLGVETRMSLAAHLRSLEVVPCPREVADLAWIRGRRVILTGWRRDLGGRLHPNEMCLWNKEKRRIEASLACGNIIINLRYDPQATWASGAGGGQQSEGRRSRVAATPPATTPQVVATQSVPLPEAARVDTVRLPGPVIPSPVTVVVHDTTLVRNEIRLSGNGTSQGISWRKTWPWAVLGGVVVAAFCENYSQKHLGNRPGSFGCFGNRTTVTNIVM